MHKNSEPIKFRPNGYGKPRNDMICRDCGESHGYGYYCDEWLTKVSAEVLEVSA